MNLQMKTMTDNNDVNPDNETHCCNCQEGRCRCREEDGECECHCHGQETPYPELPCVEADPDDFNDWD